MNAWSNSMNENLDCQDCSGKRWQVGLMSPFGHIYLCAECAAEALHNRESKHPANERRYAKLVNRVFKTAQ